MISTIFLMLLFALFAYVAWKFITIVWLKYIVAGVFALLAGYELMMLVFGVIGYPHAPFYR